MGGIGHLYAVRPLPDASPQPLLAANKALWNVVDSVVRGAIGIKPVSRMVLAEYWPDEAREKLPSWPLAPDQLGFSFGDAGGALNASMHIALHWTEIALSWRAEMAAAALRACGWEFAVPLRSLEEQIVAPRGYLVCPLDGVLYCILEEGGGAFSFFTDAERRARELSSLNARALARVQEQIATRTCRCPLCELLGPGVRRAIERRHKFAAQVAKREAEAQAAKEARQRKEAAQEAKRAEANAAAKAKREAKIAAVQAKREATLAARAAKAVTSKAPQE